MNFEELLNKKLIEKCPVPAEEVRAIKEAVDSDLNTARLLLGSDLCWAFNIAYNSMLEAGLALMYSKGFRPIGEAKHVSVILFLREILGKEYENKINRFNQMRRKRHKAAYGIIRDMTEYEAKDSVKFAAEFAEEVINFIT